MDNKYFTNQLSMVFEASSKQIHEINLKILHEKPDKIKQIQKELALLESTNKSLLKLIQFYNDTR